MFSFFRNEVIDHDWHYARPKLAKNAIELLKTGAAHALTIFARRRIGKTQFLLFDVWPEATKRGWTARYINFWGVENKAEALIRVLSQDAQQLSEVRLGVSYGDIGVEGAAVLRTPAKRSLDPTDEQIFTIQNLIAGYARKRSPLLLLVDEAQEISDVSNPDTKLSAALRTVLDQHKGRVASIFTGSSEIGLESMFGDHRAPFLQFAYRLPFPQLDDKFVSHVLNIVDPKHEYFVHDEACNVFKAVGYRPKVFRDFMIFAQNHRGEQLVKLFENRFLDELDRSKRIQFERQSTAVRAICAYIAANGDSGLYTELARQWMADTFDCTPPSKSSLQRAAKELAANYVIEKTGRGKFEIRDDAFLEFLQREFNGSC